MTSYIIRSSILGIIALIALIFIPAGTVHYWQGWAYVVTWIIVGSTYTVVGSTYTVYVARHDPALLKRRTEAGISHEKEPTQKVIIVFLFVAFIALITLPPVDDRFGRSRTCPRTSRRWETPSWLAQSLFSSSGHTAQFPALSPR